MLRLLLFRSLAALACRLPLQLCYHLAELAGSLLAFLPSTRRDAVRANLAVVYATSTDDRRVRRDARRVLRHALLNWVDLFRLGQRDTVRMIQRIHVPTLQPLDEALALGKGAILISAHLGNFDTVMQKLALRGDKVLIPVEPINPPTLLAFVRKQRSALGTAIEPIGPDTFRRLTAHLRAGGVVIIVSDRDVQGTGQPVTLFGRRITLPNAAILLALRTGAPVLGAFGCRHTDNRISARLTPGPLAAPAGDASGRRSLRADLEAGMQAWATMLEEEIRRDPGQWVVLQPAFTAAPKADARAPVGVDQARSTPPVAVLQGSRE
jgi:KDO2-lipid IV(A) lauroyltransferase